MLTLAFGCVGHYLSKSEPESSVSHKAQQSIEVSATGEAASGETWNKTPLEKVWDTVGLLIGHTSFHRIEVSGGAARSCMWTARLLGLLLIAWAFVIIAWGEYGNRFKRLGIRWRRAARGQRHVVVCGAGAAGSELANRLIDAGKHVVVIEKDGACPNLADLRDRGAIVFVGDATNSDMLESAGVGEAESMFVFCGSDRVNCRVTWQVDRQFGERRGGCIQLAQRGNTEPVLPCPCDCDKRFIVHVRLEGADYRSAMTDGGAPRLKREGKPQGVGVHCFSFSELAVRILFLRHVWVPRWREDGSGARHVHSVILGATEQAQAVLLQNLRMLHLREGQKRAITVICENADAFRQRFLRTYPCLRPIEKREDPRCPVCEGLFADVDFVEAPFSPDGWVAKDFALYRHVEPGWRVNAFFCMDDGILSQGLMERLSDPLKLRREGAGASCEVFCACYCVHPEMAQRPAVKSEGFERVDYGALVDLADPAVIETPAFDQNAQDIFMFYDETFGGGHKERRKAVDYPCVARRKWIFAAEWERESNRQAADHIGVKLALLGLERTAEDGERLRALLADEASGTLDLLARLEHRRWCAERLLGGWRPLPPGEDKRPWFSQKKSDADKAVIKRLKDELKWHADLVAFDELPPHEQKKDDEMMNFIPELLTK